LRYYEREGIIGPVQRRSGNRVYTDDDLAWIGLVTCLREAGLGIEDLRRFTELLRNEGRSDDRVEFLRRRRHELQQQAAAIAKAVDVLDAKIRHYADDS
jgi:DNA-binding transcriptional MerR regulator